MGLLDKVNSSLQNYINLNVFPMYALNGDSHGIEHINQVIKRTFEIIEEYEESDENKEKLNSELLYIVAAYMI